MTLLQTLLCFALLHHHPLHVSFTNIDINREERALSLSIKCNTEDFSLLFFHLYEKNITPEPGKDFTEAQLALINEYISRSFSLVAGKDTLDLAFTKKEQDDLYLWLYYSASFKAVKKGGLVLNNSLLLDLYQDQTNLVIVSDGARETGYKCDFQNRRCELDVDMD